MNKRQLTKAFKELGVEKEDYGGLTREEMEVLYYMFMLAETFQALVTMARISPMLTKMTDILQGQEDGQQGG